MTFDLKKARACAAFVEPKEAFLEALAEIERLRASLTDLHAEYINTLEKNPECSAWDLDEQSIEDQRRLRRNAAHAISIVEPPIYLQADQQATKILELEAISRRRNEIINKQVAKIKELKADLEQSERVIDQQAARIGELEAQLTITNVALENATRKPNVVYITGTGEIGADATKTIDQTPNSAENMQKTGPDSPKMAVWQITDERKAALSRAYDVISWIDRVDSDNQKHIDVLRAMLKEAGQE